MDRQATPVGSQVRKLLAATLALVACRVVSQWNSLVAGVAAVGVIFVLAASIIAGMPRVRRILRVAALPASTLANALALGLGSFFMLLGAQGLLAYGRIGHQGPPWNLAFALVPLAAATNLVWLTRPISRPLWLGYVWLINLASAGYAVWCWQTDESFPIIAKVPLPAATTILVSLAILSLSTLTWDTRVQASSSPSGWRFVRSAFVSAFAFLIVGSIWLGLFPAYRTHQAARSLETFGFHAGFGELRWHLPAEVPFQWYEYLGEIDSVWADEPKGDTGEVGRLLNSLPWLAAVHVDDLPVGAERILRPSAGQTRLRRVYLAGAGVTDETLADAGRIPALRWARFDRARITDAGLANLAGLQWLQSLAIRQTPISGDGLVHLQSLPRLTQLDLSGTDMGDRQMAELPKFKALASLMLDRTRLTDEGLASLARCKTLKQVSLSGTRVTESGVDQLRRALPKCDVVWQPAADP